MIDYKRSNNIGYRYTVIVIDNFSKYTWVIPLNNKNAQKFANEISNSWTSSQRRLLKIESDRSKFFHNSVSQNFSEGNWIN